MICLLSYLADLWIIYTNALVYQYKIDDRKLNEMEVLNKTSAMLSNYEVLQILEEYAKEKKEKSKMSKRDQNLSTVTYETIKYLNDTPSVGQNEETIQKVVRLLEPFKLTKAEKLQLVNLRPTTPVELSLIIEESEERISEEQIDEILDIVANLPETSADIVK